MTWPDVDHNLVCGDCKVLVYNMDTVYSTCDAYCANIGRSCTGAWEEVDETCSIKSTEHCNHDFGAYTSDAICECGIDGGIVVPGMYETFLKLLYFVTPVI